jgi:hypothetical protein
MPAARLANVSWNFLFLDAPDESFIAASRVNDTTTKAVQPEIAFPSKAENSNTHAERERPNSISMDRGKATMAFSFTDSPPNEYGVMSSGECPMRCGETASLN